MLKFTEPVRELVIELTNPPMSPCHLIVLQHGLWGRADNLAVLQALLLEHHKAISDEDGMQVQRVLNCTANEEMTYDGVCRCGERLVQVIRDEIARLQEDEGLMVVRNLLSGVSSFG